MALWKKILIGGGLLIVVILSLVGIGTIAFSSFIVWQQHQYQLAREKKQTGMQVFYNGPIATLQLVLPGNKATESAWMGDLIAEDLLTQVHFMEHPDQTIPQYQVNVQDNGAFSVNPEMRFFISNPDLGPGAAPTSIEVPLEFPWQAIAYKYMASRLFSRSVEYSKANDPEADLLLADLLNATGPKLAEQDVRLSALLQTHPGNPQLHEEAALLLLSLAWKEKAKYDADTRRLLCRATAQLAMADALAEPASTPSWNNQIADLLLRTLAGREVDVIKKIDDLTAQPNLPQAVKDWCLVMRLTLIPDWRNLSITDKSPLLVKVAWFRAMVDDLGVGEGTQRFIAACPNPENVPDWARAIANHQFGYDVENGHRFATSVIDQEIAELSQEMVIEKDASAQLQLPLAEILQKPEATTVLSRKGELGEIHALGAGSFVQATRRHLRNEITAAENWMQNAYGDADQAAQFKAIWAQSDRHVPSLEEAKTGTVNVADLPPDLCILLKNSEQNSKLFFHFYQTGEPFGTVYDPYGRMQFYSGMPDNLKKFPLPNNIQFNLFLQSEAISHLTDVQAMAPNNYLVAQKLSDYYPDEKKVVFLQRFFDYDVRALLLFTESSYKGLPPSTREMIFTKAAQLNPYYYFTLGEMLRSEGRADEAAAVDRKGAAECPDPVGVANSVLPLVKYDLAHGQREEAEKLAKNAADVYSETGLNTYCYYLEKTGQFAEEEKWAQALMDRYDSNDRLTYFYLHHKDLFKTKADALLNNAFPNGLTKVNLASFTAPPTSGARFLEESNLLIAAGLDSTMTIVALNSYKVESLRQYLYVRGLLDENETMDFIIYDQNGHYREITANPPDHHFGVNMGDYPPR